MRASVDDGGKSVSQRSQFGRSSSIWGLLITRHWQSIFVTGTSIAARPPARIGF